MSLNNMNSWVIGIDGQLRPPNHTKTNITFIPQQDIHGQMTRVHITERAIWAILTGQEPPLALSPDETAIIICDNLLDGYPIATLRKPSPQSPEHPLNPPPTPHNAANTDK